jgi:hypothetical protein
MRSKGWVSFLKGLHYFATSMAFMFVECNIIMCCVEDQHGLFRTKQMIITLEEKYILESLIKFGVTFLYGCFESRRYLSFDANTQTCLILPQ